MITPGKAGDTMIRCGLDIVELERINEIRNKHDFDSRIFTEQERVCGAAKGGRPEYFAGRWAAKEAVAKVLGCGFGKNCSPDEIEILPDDSGAPQLRLTGAALKTAERAGIVSWSISISHEKHYAAAVAVAETAPTQGGYPNEHSVDRR